MKIQAGAGAELSDSGMGMNWPPLGRDVFGGGVVGSSETPEAHPGVTDIVGLPGECADQGMPGDGRTLGSFP